MATPKSSPKGKSSTAKVAILCPSLRPETHQGIEANLRETTKDYKVYFLGEEYPSYATAINEGFKKTTEPFIFLGADDLVFSEGWLEAALKKMKPGIGVVGTNDGAEPNRNHRHQGTEFPISTHFLIRREYIDKHGGTFDEIPGKVCHEYLHNYPDTEQMDVAIWRKAYADAPDSLVTHNHPVWGTAPWDKVYTKGRNTAPQDKKTYWDRRETWAKKHNITFVDEELHAKA